MSEEKIIFYDFGEFRLDVVNCRLLRNGSPVQLTHKSFEILYELIENRDRMLRKEELLSKIWEDCYVEEATLTQHIYMLRKALQQNGKIYIETFPKNGYRFVADVKEIILNNNNGFKKREISDGVELSQSNPKFETDPAKFENVKHSQIGERIFKKNNPTIKQIAQISAGFCVLAILIGLYFYLRGNNSPPATESANIKSIAVLPFKQIGIEKDEKLGLGMADVLITKLGNVENLEVLPTSAIIRYAEQDIYNLTEIGENLGVDAVLSGTIQRDEDIIRVTIQFYNIETQSFLWSEKFDEKLTNIFLLQDSISERISKELALRLKGTSKIFSDNNYTKNIEAHQAYSMGLYHWNLRTEDGLKKAAVYFQNAINLDPNFALAYAYLADTCALIVYYRMDSGSSEETLRKAKEAAQKALAIDPNCSEAMTALATINTGENRVEESFDLLQKAIKIKPNNVAAHQRIAWMYAHNDDLEKAVGEMKTAQNLDPQARATNIGLAQLLNIARRPDESIPFSRRLLELNPNDETAKLRLAESFEQKGNMDEAEKLIREISGINEKNTDAAAALSRILAKKNDKKNALEIVKKISSGKNADSFNYEIALVYAVLGDNKKAVNLLKKTIDDGKFIKLFLRNDYNLDPLRQDAEFVKIVN